ncbi:hypothetical protein F511_30322 [Dorcoceras hygrometricum]|uniref:DM2 domain-containing protein n=1 Tax=Dorcoceras hygrometricum TaxID=472368 RepID=A0A2Z7C2N3_9LAMI|nr:hypothetical protein F511_30322 [Dorcoceras hygrometricum]
MGLNPPFGVNAALANKFINKALEFKPKLLILIVPRETQRLDEKDFPYDLVWEDDQMFSGKSFYLPGSVDVNDNQIEDWNITAPVIYLWSHPDWTSRHKDIAVQHGHSSGALKKNSMEEKQECHNLDKSFVRKGEDKNPEKPENQEQETRVTPSRQVNHPRDRKSTTDDKKDVQFKNHAEANPKKKLGDKPRKRRGLNDKSLVDNSNKKQPVAGNASPNLADGRPLYSHSSRHHERTKHVHAGRDDYQQSGSRNVYTPYSQNAYNGNQDEFLVRNYSLNTEEQYPNMPGMPSRQSYSPGLPEYDYRGLNDRRMGYPQGRTDHLHASIPGREVPITWTQRIEHLSHPEPGFQSPCGPLNAASNPFYDGMNTSAISRYAARLDELNHMNAVPRTPAPETIYRYHPPVPEPGYQGFAPGPYYHP